MVIGDKLADITGNKTFVDTEDRYKEVAIEDIPILYCPDGSICCIPKTKEVKAIAFVGNSGSGKSLAMNRLHSHIFYQWRSNVAIMNDVSDETYKWSEPMTNRIFNDFNKKILNQSPVESPMVYVFPHSKTIEVDRDSLYENDKCFLKTVLPFEKVVEEVGFYLNGVSPDFELGKSGMYVNDIKEKLIECETPSQIRLCLEENLPGTDGKSFGAMRTKIITAFDSLVSEQILDITNPECHAYLRLEHSNLLENPLTIIMKSGRIPSLMTSDLINKKYKSQVFAYYIDALFESNLRIFNNKKTYMFFDELRDVCGKEDEPATMSLSRIASRGRIKNIGLVYATQFYNQIPHKVRGAKLNYLFAFKHGDEQIVDVIKKDFSLSRENKQKIFKLNTFECLAMTQDHFVFYRDNEKWTSSDPVVGRIFYPLADHKSGGSNE